MGPEQKKISRKLNILSVNKPAHQLVCVWIENADPQCKNFKQFGVRSLLQKIAYSLANTDWKQNYDFYMKTTCKNDIHCEVVSDENRARTEQKNKSWEVS